MRFKVLSILEVTLGISMLFLYSNSAAQCGNLVPNGSFELFNALPNDDCDWELATGWNNAATSNNCNTTNGTPDYYHLQGQGEYSSLPSNYFANVNPFEGSAVMGIGGSINLSPNFREYIAIALSSPLIIGQSYTMSYSITSGIPNVGGLYVNGWGASLSVGPLLQSVGTSNVIPITNFYYSVPGVFNSQQWQTFTFTFVADQAYDHFTFGNFLSQANQTAVPFGTQGFLSIAYVFLDAVSITSSSNLPLSIDVSDFNICAGENILINAEVSGGVEPYTYSWNPNINSTSSSITLNPTQTTTYTLDVTDCNGNIASTSFDINVNQINTIDFQNACSSFTWIDGLTYTTNTNTPTFTLTSSSGCDSVVTLNLTINSLITGIDTQIACNSFTWINGITYTSNTNIPTFTLTSASGCDSIVSLNLTIELESNFINPIVNLGEDQFLCTNSLTLDATTLGAQSYLWNTGSTNNQLLITDPGVYIVEASNICFTSLDTITIFQGNAPIPLFDVFAQLCIDDSVLIGPSTSTNDSIIWSDGYVGAPRYVNQLGNYTISFISVCDTQTVTIQVKDGDCEECIVYIPNSFSPNFDGLNDQFSPLTECTFEQFEFLIFNRWGEIIYQSSKQNEKWDGKYQGMECPENVYVYLMTYKFPAQSAKRITGDITIIK